jgi:hypothetical protein
MWSVMVFAFDGPTPMLTMVMPAWPGRVRWYAGICGSRSGGTPEVGATSPASVMTLPGSTKLS